MELSDVTSEEALDITGEQLNDNIDSRVVNAYGSPVVREEDVNRRESVAGSGNDAVACVVRKQSNFTFIAVPNSFENNRFF